MSVDNPRLQAVAVWAISTWPAINFISVNWGEVAHQSPMSLVGILVFTVVTALIAHGVLRLAARSGRGGFFVVIWLELVCLFFGYAAIRDASRRVFESAGLPIPPFAGFIMASVVVFGVTACFRRVAKLQAAAVVFCLAAAGIALLMLGVTVLRSDSQATGQPVAHEAGASAGERARGPNVYYIILDSYPGARGLSLAGIDNSAFMQRMAARGFVDRSTDRSNYLTTAQELGSMFALDYAQTDEPRQSGNPGALYPRLLEGEASPPWVARFKAAGYVTWHSASVWDDCPRKHFRCLGEFVFMRLDQMTQAYFAPTPFGRPLLYIIGRRHDALVSIVRDLPSLANSAEPVFVFGHHMSPHPPFLFDKDCQPYPHGRDMLDNWHQDPRTYQAFVEAITCVNREVERLVDEILRLDPDPLIVLQGDHGSAFTMDWAAPMASWSAASIGERASYLSLVRSPGRCAHWLDRALGQINTARFAVACAEGRKPVYLTERTYLSTYVRGPELGVVRRFPD